MDSEVVERVSSTELVKGVDHLLRTLKTSGRLKQSDSKFHFARESTGPESDFTLEHIPDKEMVANIFTKPSGAQFTFC